MNYTTTQKLCDDLLNNSNSEEDLMDYIASSNKLFLGSIEGARLDLIYILDADLNSSLNELKMNLITGKYETGTIFVCDKPYVFNSIDQSDDSIIVKLSNEETGKSITSKLQKFTGSKTRFRSKDVFHLELDDVSNIPASEIEMISETIDNDISSITEKLSKVKNNIELNNLIQNLKNKYLMKSFSKEAAILATYVFEHLVLILGIYVSYEEEFQFRAESVRSLPIRNCKITYEQIGGKLLQFVDGKYQSTISLYATSDSDLNYMIQFPSGESGIGDWDISNEF